MPPSRRKLAARLALVAFAALCLARLASLDFSQTISTNVIDLLPPEEHSAEAALVRGFAGDVHARVMLFSLRNDDAASALSSEAAAAFADALRRSGHFEAVVLPGDPAARDALGRAVFERRFALLLPSWLGRMQREFHQTRLPDAEFAAWTADRATAELEDFVARPEALPLEKLLPADPLLLVPRLIASWQDFAPAGASSSHALVWARLRASPLAEAGQLPVFAAIDQAERELRAKHPALRLEWTGVNRFAAASRAHIEREFAWLNIGSLAAVLLVAALFVQRFWQIGHLVPAILASLLGAWTASTLAFERIHILVFVIGALLTGVAIDYGFYLALQPAAHPGEPFGEKLRRLIKPLLVSCLTTVIGFSLLLWSDLPLLRQVGFFVGTGLLCALGAAILYFAQLDRPFLAARRPAVLDSGRFASRTLPRLLLVLAVAVASTVPWRLRWRDDIRELEISSPELRANDRALRARFGESPERSVFLTHGPTVGSARQHLDDFLAHLAAATPAARASSLGAIFPTESDWQAFPARLRQLENFPAAFRTALERHGFDANSFAPFFRHWPEAAAPPAGDYLSLYRDLAPHLSGPLSQLFSWSGARPWFLTIVDQRLAAVPPAELHTIPLNQLESLNNLFTRYRWSALRLSLIGLGLVIASVFVVYRGRTALRIATVPLGACCFVFGCFALLGRPLNLFHLLGAFLGVCLSHNYAIFSSESSGRRALPPTAIRLSALTTAASFGVLAFSRIPVIHALGATVAAVVLTTLVALEIEARTP